MRGWSDIGLLLSGILLAAITSVGLLIGCGQGANGKRPISTQIRPLPGTAEILFASNRDTHSPRQEIYSMDSQGGHITRITTTDQNHFVFGIDRSKRYIVATRGTERMKRLWLLNLETGEEIPLTDAEDNAEGRTFSPDGEWIVFWMIPAGETYSDIYKIRRDGTELTNLTNTPTAHEFDPAWSNTGDRIAFNYNDGHPNRFILKTMDTYGGNIRTIYDREDSVATAMFPAGVYDPSWSPDDKWIAVDTPIRFTGKGENGYAGVWHTLKVRADGSEVIDLSEAGEHTEWAEYLPSFSPDGKSIVFSARYGSEDPSTVSIEIFRMDANGDSMEQLTESHAYSQFAVWVR